LRTDHLDAVSNFAIPIICRSPELLRALVAGCEGRIEVRPIVGGDMTQQPFLQRRRRELGEAAARPNAALAHAQGLYVGNRPDLEPAEMDEIIRLFAGPLPSAGGS
jgi:CDP-6-deoxy-D-xylo-4-hexulose-3-dehydrase